MQDFEKLGLFYLGREYDLKAGQATPNLLLYDSKDLTTHAVVVGMTGSGKTGLCIDLLEEAGMDRIPAIVIDPKGDISNLLLTFPELSADSFLPWIDVSQAKREGLAPEQFARREAKKWENGLADWGQDADRIRRLRNTVDMQIYTPGSDAGRPLAILRSFTAPSSAVQEDSDALRERIRSAASGLLALLGIDADPIRSREHILISRILDDAWRQGNDLNLAQLIGQIQKPPFDRVGVMDLDTFFPSRDRMELAMTLNNLLASPSFASWLAGEELNIKRLLHTEEGRPRISILSIAHLSDNERMFFVTILLNEILSWMRSQEGTSSLRAILYMDEVFGYFPPVASPPSKLPMLTLLKQARAYGLGIVLATQNPVDLDYKGLSNTGTWFLGRLQTERDKARVLEGLEGASAQAGSNFDRSEMEAILARLGQRKFLMNNVHEEQPVIFETRWAMSYLRGPLARNQIRRLADSGDAAQSAPATPSAANAAAATAPPPEPPVQAASVAAVDPRTLIPIGIEQCFVPPTEPVGRDRQLVYRAELLATGRLHFSRTTYKVDEWSERAFLTRPTSNDMPDEVWDKARRLNAEPDCDSEPVAGARFLDVPTCLQSDKNFKAWKKEFKAFLYRSQATSIYRCKSLKAYSRFGESLGDFKVRLGQLVAEKRDAELDKLRSRWESKFQTMKDRIRRAEEKVEQQEEQLKQSRLSSVLNTGITLMGAILGRKRIGVTTARQAGTTIRSMSRTAKEKGDVDRAEENLEKLVEQRKAMEAQFEQDLKETAEQYSVQHLEIETLPLAPKKSDISLQTFAVCWLPYAIDPSGIPMPVHAIDASVSQAR